MNRHMASGILLLLAFGARAAAMEQPMIGQAAPGFDLPTAEGGGLSLADQRGKTIVLHFGAGW